jgi:hypothetical protein
VGGAVYAEAGGRHNEPYRFFVVCAILGFRRRAMPHVVLVGDSVFDNAAYSAPDPGVEARLIAELGDQWKVTLLAVDGSLTQQVHEQLAGVPQDVDWLVLSTGGNDALGHQELLVAEAASYAEVLTVFGEAIDRFATDYEVLLKALVREGTHTAVCTIYNGYLPAPYGDVAPVAVSLFNDAIYRLANRYRLPVLELRSICNEPGDYVNGIEPSASGGAKIAGALAELLLSHK